MREYYTNAFYIKKHFTDNILKRILKITCEITNSNKPISRNLLHGFSSTLGGEYAGDYDPLNNEFSLYVYKRNLEKKIEDYDSEHLSSKMKKWFNDWKNKTLLDYTIKKYGKDFSFKIIKKKSVEWDKLDFELKEKLIMGALKTKPIIRELMEYRREVKKTNKHGITKKIMVYYNDWTIQSDEDDNYFLIVRPKYKFVSQDTIYTILKKSDEKNRVRILNKLLNNAKIITSANLPLKKHVKVNRVIKPTEKEYWDYVKRINAYYKKSKIPITVGGDDSNCLILLGEDGYPYHTQNSLLYEGLTDDVQKQILDRKQFLDEMNNIIKILQKDRIIDFTKDNIKLPLNKNYRLIRLKQIPKIEVKLKKWMTDPKLYDYNILSRILDWIHLLMSDKKEGVVDEICFPLSSPLLLHEVDEIGIYIFYNNDVPHDHVEFVELLFSKLNALHALDKNIPKIEVKLKQKINFKDYSNSRVIITQTVRDVEKNERPFIICITPELPKREFNELKAHLFSYSQTTFNQVIQLERLNKCMSPYTNEIFKKSYLNSILFQFFHKLGLYMYSLSGELGDYDFIIGYDVSREKEFNGKTRGIGGSAILYNNQGHVNSIIPFDDPGSSEIGRYEELFTCIHSELAPQLNLDSNDKLKILLLKDGRIYKKELEILSNISKKYNYDITYIDVRKSTPLRFWTLDNGIPTTKDKNMYCKFGRRWYISSHYYTGFLKQPITIVEKYIISDGNYETKPLTEKDIKQLILLTKINYSQTMPDKMRLPAPVHYAHKHVNAIRKGWKVKDPNILRSGCLPTL